MTNKKQLLIVISLLTVVVVGALLIRYYTSFHSVDINLSDDLREVSVNLVTNEDSTLLQKITEDKIIKLQEGEYSIIPVGDKFSDKPIGFSVPATSSLSVNPDFSEDYLSEKASGEISKVETTLSKAFPEQLSKFAINNYQLLKRGQWMGVVLTPNQFEFQNPEGVHRTLLKKDNDSWLVVEYPEPILTIYTTPDVPVDVLTQVNDITYKET